MKIFERTNLAAWWRHKIATFVMAVLVGFCFWHARRVAPDTELLVERTPQSAAA